MYRIFFILLDIIVVAIFTVPIGFFFQHFFTERTKKRKLIWLFIRMCGIDNRQLFIKVTLNAICPLRGSTFSPQEIPLVRACFCHFS